jgi:nucleoid DNA-binding protein
MATAKKTIKTTPSKKAPAAKTVSAPRPIKTAFNRTTLNQHIAEQAGVAPKVVKAVLVALETAMLSSIHKKGLGEFTLPGLLKITALSVPAKKRRFGKDPFSGEERWFAPKPASIKIKTRALKKLKDAAL